MSESWSGEVGGGVVRGASRRCRDESRLAVRKRRLLEAAAWGALILPGLAVLPEVAWSQVAATLPEVTVVAPRPAPSPPRRQAPAARRAAASPPVAPATTPVPSALPAFQVIATTPVTGIGFDRSKVPAMAQTVTAADFSRVYSPNVLDTLQQRIPGVITTDVQGNGFFQDLRYRGFAASPLQGTPQGLAVYMQGVRINDDGWRYQSPSRIGRFYGDLGWRGTDAEVHFITSIAYNYFGVVGPTPLQLLNNDYRAIYTWPQTTKNQAQLIAMNGRYSVTDHWTVQSNLYYRKFQQAHVDGNTAEVERCSGQAANPLFNTLCLEDDGFPRQPAANFQLLNQNNRPINCPPGPGNTCATTPWGTVDRTWTNAITTGASLQGINDDKIFGHDNYFTIGGSVDRSKIGFQANSELGYIYPDFFVGPNAAVPGTGQIVHTAANIGFAPVSLAAWNTYYGIYVSDTFDITNRLSVTAGGRYNIAQIAMSDLLGTSPDLSAQYTFERFNPVVGFTYKILPELMTFYAGYSEANRAPTPLELGCSNPLRPCLLEGFLVSDPPLNQVVARTKEVGLRGNFSNAGGRGDWKLGLFRTDSESDIIQVASVLQGRGVFQNVPATRRQGLEAGAQYQTERYLVYANYALVDATYQFTGLLASPNNPSANANGDILVTPGKQIPGIPLHQIKGGVDYWVTPLLKLGTDVIWVSSQWYVGDDANQNVKLADYWVANLHGSYQLTKELQLYGVINNLFNRKFATVGTYFDPQSVINAVSNPPTDHRTITPAQPLSIYMGIRAKL